MSTVMVAEARAALASAEAEAQAARVADAKEKLPGLRAQFLQVSEKYEKAVAEFRKYDAEEKNLRASLLPAWQNVQRLESEPELDDALLPEDRVQEAEKWRSRHLQLLSEMKEAGNKSAVARREAQQLATERTQVQFTLQNLLAVARGHRPGQV